MKTVKEKNNYQMPGKPMTQAEFEKHIKEAEKGPFKSWGQSKKDFEIWRNNLKKNYKAR
jgi:hypothetical protein